MRAAVPLIDDPGYVTALRELCEQHDVGAVLPLTDLDIEVLAQARDEGRLPALVPCAGDRPRDLRQVRDAPAAAAPRRCPRRRPCCPTTDLDALDYPVMVKPRRGSGARSIHLARDAAQARFFVDYVDEPVMVQRAMGGPELSIDCLGDLRRALPQRDPPHDARVARRRVDQGRRSSRDDELIELGRRTMEALARDRARAPSRSSATPTSASASPTSTRASAAPSRRPPTPRCPGAPTPS